MSTGIFRRLWIVGSREPGNTGANPVRPLIQNAGHVATAGAGVEMVKIPARQWGILFEAIWTWKVMNAISGGKSIVLSKPEL
jgi:hypothetical protein